MSVLPRSQECFEPGKPAVFTDAFGEPAIVVESLSDAVPDVSRLNFDRSPDGSIGLSRDALYLLAEAAASGAKVWLMPGTNIGNKTEQEQTEEGLPAKGVLVADNIKVDMDQQRAFLDGQVIECPRQEYKLLEFFMRYSMRALSRDDIIGHVWGEEYLRGGGRETVTVHVRRLRKRINDTDLSIIETVRSVGYRFNRQSVSLEEV